MRVLWYNLSNVGRKGGDTIQCRETMKALRERGVECGFSDNLAEPLASWDIVHIMHCQFNECVNMMGRCIDEGKPFVVSAIFYAEIPCFPHLDVLNQALGVIALSDVERREILERTGCRGDLVRVIPNGVDKSIFYPAERLGMGVIGVGMMHPDKGLCHTAKACKLLGLPFTSVDTRGIDDPYAEMVRGLSAETYRTLPQADLADLYRRHRVCVCASHTDRQSLVPLEAAACGLNIVDSIYNRGAGLLRSSVVTDPRNPEALALAIQKQYARIVQNYCYVPSWGDVARKIQRLYEAV